MSMLGSEPISAATKWPKTNKSVIAGLNKTIKKYTTDLRSSTVIDDLSALF